MDSSAIPVFLAGPFPVVHTSRLDDVDAEVELDIAILVGGLPTILAATRFPFDDGWERIEAALGSGDARLGVAGVPHEAEAVAGVRAVFPSAYVGLECANGERLVLAHIRGSDPQQQSEAFAREVIGGILQGHTPADLGELIDD